MFAEVVCQNQIERRIVYLVVVFETVVDFVHNCIEQQHPNL
jgi:hypothetical protein